MNRSAHYHKWTEAETQTLMGYLRDNSLDWDGAQKTLFPLLSIPQIKNKYYMTLKYKGAVFSPTDFGKREWQTKQRDVPVVLTPIDLAQMIKILGVVFE